MMMILIFCILTMFCVYLVNYYANKEVSLHVKVWSVITWVLNFGLALLVPEDVFVTLNKETHSQYGHLLGSQYVILYWLVYVLTWTIIPVLQEWEDAGDLESRDRLRRSLKINGMFYLVLLGIAVVALLVIFFLGIGKDMGLVIFLKCLATMWGMLLLMILMGYSLV